MEVLLITVAFVMSWDLVVKHHYYTTLLKVSRGADPYCLEEYREMRDVERYIAALAERECKKSR